jgi:hypothetical protein
LRQDDYKFKPSLGYTVRPFLKKNKKQARHQWLKLLRRQRSGGSWFETNPGKYFERPYLENLFTKIGLVE